MMTRDIRFVRLYTVLINSMLIVLLFCLFFIGKDGMKDFRTMRALNVGQRSVSEIFDHEGEKSAQDVVSEEKNNSSFIDKEILDKDDSQIFSAISSALSESIISSEKSSEPFVHKENLIATVDDKVVVHSQQASIVTEEDKNIGNKSAANESTGVSVINEANVDITNNPQNILAKSDVVDVNDEHKSNVSTELINVIDSVKNYTNAKAIDNVGEAKTEEAKVENNINVNNEDKSSISPSRIGNFIPGRAVTIIRGMGFDVNLAKYAIQNLPQEVMLGFSSIDVDHAALLHRVNHKILIHVPIFADDETDLTKVGLYKSLSFQENSERLRIILSQFSNIDGIYIDVKKMIDAGNQIGSLVLNTAKKKNLIMVNINSAVDPKLIKNLQNSSIKFISCNYDVRHGTVEMNKVLRDISGKENISYISLNANSENIYRISSYINREYIDVVSYDNYR